MGKADVVHRIHPRHAPLHRVGPETRRAPAKPSATGNNSRGSRREAVSTENEGPAVPPAPSAPPPAPAAAPAASAHQDRQDPKAEPGPYAPSPAGALPTHGQGHGTSSPPP